MSKDYYTQMEKDILDTDGISSFLLDNNMPEVLKTRIDGIEEYNIVSFDVIKRYILLLLKTIQTSPIIQNKEEIIECILRVNDILNLDNAAILLIKLKDCMDILIQNNMIERQGPFLFKHGTLYSVIPSFLGEDGTGEQEAQI